MPYEKSKVTNFGRGKSLSGFEYCHQVSAVQGEAPAATELSNGELALNSADGKLFYKSSQGGSVLPVKGATVGLTGVVNFSDINNALHSISITNGLITDWIVDGN